MIHLKEEQKKITNYLKTKSEERGYIVKDNELEHSIEIYWPRYFGAFNIKVTLEAKGVGFIYVEMTYRCHTRMKKNTPYGNLFSLDYGISDEMLCDIEKGIVREVERFEQKIV